MSTDLYAAFLAGDVPASALGEPNWGPNGKVVYERTYSRPLFRADGTKQPWTMGDTEGRTHEVWAETCRRVVLGNTQLSPETLLDDEQVDLFAAMLHFAIIPAGRHLWVDGTGHAWTRNCLARETEVITRDGVRAIGDIVGQTVEVIDGNGAWVEAEAKSFGVQRLSKLTLSRGPSETKTIYATDDHGWFVYRKNKPWSPHRKVTQELRPGDQLVSRIAKSHVRAGKTTTPSPIGIQHGFVYGDGSIMGGRGGYAVAYFCGQKDAPMMEWFSNFEAKERADGVEYVANLPRYFKKSPSLDESSSYLYGFLAGYFAADGHASKTGSCTITSSSRANLEMVRDICNRLGIATYSIREQVRQGYGGQTSLFWLTINKNHLTPEFFLIDEHRENWERSLKPVSQRSHRDTNAWTVVAVEPTNRMEEVFCFEIPTTHSFVLDGNILTSNCFSAPMGERTSGHFRFLGSRLFEGGGVGANYSNDLLADTTPVQRQVSVTITCREDHDDIMDVMASANGNWCAPQDIDADAQYVRVPDTREGWVEAWGTLIDTACSAGEAATFVFDVSDVRPFGAPLATYGGTASGPAPLVHSLVAFEGILGGALGRRLTSMEAMDMDHEIAASVVAGGSRRSARLAAKHWSDADIFDFIVCKADMSKHWSTNISVEIDDDFERAYFEDDHVLHAHAMQVMQAVAEGMAANGEPGFINSSRLSEGERTRIRTTNPCSEIALETEGSEYGEACNIGSVNLDVVGTDHRYGQHLFELLARFLYRSTLLPYPDAGASYIEARNRRIGAGFMGLQEWGLHHDVRYCDMPYSDELTNKLLDYRHTVRQAADQLADQLGTPRSIKVTCVAPNGSISKLPGVAPGVHPVLARYAEQRIRFGSADPKLQEMAAKGYDIEPCVYAQNTMVVTIPTSDPIVSKGFDESIIQQADEVHLADFLTVETWVSQQFCGGNDGNAVSATASIPAGSSAEGLTETLLQYIFALKGTTVFPNASRAQQPVTPITREAYEDMVAYCEAMSASLADDCSTGACPIR